MGCFEGWALEDVVYVFDTYDLHPWHCFVRRNSHCSRLDSLGFRVREWYTLIDVGCGSGFEWGAMCGIRILGHVNSLYPPPHPLALLKDVAHM